MTRLLGSLKEFSFATVVLRMCLAMAAGGLIGYGRTKRNRTAGFRTFMLTGIGASLTVLVAMYEYNMMLGDWAGKVSEVGMKFDASRFSAQVIGGIGFLAAGSIVAGAHQQVQGLTTAAGLFASVCMGIAAGAGFYECVIAAMIMIIVTLNGMIALEALYKRRTRNTTLYVEFDNIENIDAITSLLRQRNTHIYGIEVERTEAKEGLGPAAVFSLRLAKERASHSDIMTAIAELGCVYSVEELIS